MNKLIKKIVLAVSILILSVTGCGGQNSGKENSGQKDVPLVNTIDISNDNSDNSCW